MSQLLKQLPHDPNLPRLVDYTYHQVDQVHQSLIENVLVGLSDYYGLHAYGVESGKLLVFIPEGQEIKRTGLIRLTAKQIQESRLLFAELMEFFKALQLKDQSVKIKEFHCSEVGKYYGLK